MSLSTLFPNYPEGRYNCLAVMSHRQLIRRLRYKHYSPDGRVEHQVRYNANPPSASTRLVTTINESPPAFSSLTTLCLLEA